ncbi:hypothetical protein A9236_05900 [Polynucleobacter sp. QLW-P1DATA-2]|jgi:hypothetical protein|uniref:DUF5672 family protein n=1 Tax=unclassified Polynucleobacter TaxID=2640945 RepID=UPI0008F87E7D|nr:MULTISPECIES: DUF5672 family protein [unclassified Polynucleobacter]OIN00743.1 hypothetical protein A9236_05900 [Polynucleobacter sp. QLW-P1DATA-2]OIN02305.1 hypothetical protein A9235_00975 [Polynucleobacter sp. MWH-Tro8-2-5-gr]
MKKLAAVIIDTYQNKHLASIAIHMALQLPSIQKIYTFSDEPFFPGATFIEIPKLVSNNDYGSIVLDEIPKYVREDHFLIIQWDGFPLFPQNWSDEFLKYDYIGAPLLDGWVGNGGFSLRSQRLIQALTRLGVGIDKSICRDQPEDEIICTKYRAQLEAEGIKFAPLEVAEKFSFQIGAVRTNMLGFHSADNLPLFIPEAELTKFSDQIVERIFQPIMMLRYLQACINVGYRELFLSTISGYENKPNLLKAINWELKQNPQSDLPFMIQKLNK